MLNSAQKEKNLTKPVLVNSLQTVSKYFGLVMFPVGFLIHWRGCSAAFKKNNDWALGIYL